MEDSFHIPGSKRDTCQQTSPPDIQICSEPITPFLLCSLLICTEKVEARAAMNFALEIMPGTDCHGLSIFLFNHPQFPLHLFWIKIHLGPRLDIKYTLSGRHSDLHVQLMLI